MDLQIERFRSSLEKFHAGDKVLVMGLLKQNVRKNSEPLSQHDAIVLWWADDCSRNSNKELPPGVKVIVRTNMVDGNVVKKIKYKAKARHAIFFEQPFNIGQIREILLEADLPVATQNAKLPHVRKIGGLNPQPMILSGGLDDDLEHTPLIDPNIVTSTPVVVETKPSSPPVAPIDENDLKPFPHGGLRQFVQENLDQTWEDDEDTTDARKKRRSEFERLVSLAKSQGFSVKEGSLSNAILIECGRRKTMPQSTSSNGTLSHSAPTTSAATEPTMPVHTNNGTAAAQIERAFTIIEEFGRVQLPLVQEALVDILELNTLSNKVVSLEGEITSLKSRIQTLQTENDGLLTANRTLHLTANELRAENDRLLKIEAEIGTALSGLTSKIGKPKK